ncbi:hypothetical protein BH11CYA1_BH11CYA1_06860 [soil metagenome]
MNTKNDQLSCKCGQSQVLVWQNNRRCIACGAWLEDNDHVATYYVVNRTLHKVLNHGFVSSLTASNGRIIKEVVFAKKNAVEQQRLEFRLPESTDCATEVRCSVRWFKLDERADYQYLNKASGRVVNNKQVPAAVRAVACQLARANMQPGSLRFTEVNLAGNFEGRKFIRMEQSYALDEATAHDTSLILRVEFSWS